MKVDKPDWFVESEKEKSCFSISMPQPTGTATIVMQYRGHNVQFVNHSSFYTGSGLKGLAKQLYHLGVYLEQRGK